MLSYRHGYHAGNRADVLKHAVLTWIADYLCQKDKPWVYQDTHAGGGHYDLQHPYAQKTGEFQQGIAKVWQQSNPPALLKPYLKILHNQNPSGSLQRYPGSPLFIADLMAEQKRPQDRLLLSECHATEARILKQLFEHQKHVQIFETDGFAALKSQLPPAERRGLYLIDPSYELEEDYKLVTRAIKDALVRFATGIYVLWYPVVYRRHCELLHERLKNIEVPFLRVEHCWTADTGTHGMTGAGLFILNPPWQLADRINEARNWLNDKLCEPNQGQWRINGDIV